MQRNGMLMNISLCALVSALSCCRAAEIGVVETNRSGMAMFVRDGKTYNATVESVRDGSQRTVNVLAMQTGNDAAEASVQRLVSLPISDLVTEKVLLAVDGKGSRLCVLLGRRGPGVASTELHCYERQDNHQGEGYYVPQQTAKIPGKNAPVSMPFPLSRTLGERFREWEARNTAIGRYELSNLEMRLNDAGILGLTGNVGQRFTFSAQIDVSRPGGARFVAFEMAKANDVSDKKEQTNTP